jgi:hypothetical protein
MENWGLGDLEVNFIYQLGVILGMRTSRVCSCTNLEGSSGKKIILARDSE